MAAKILVIDDEEQIRDMLRELLEMEGFIVFDAANGKEALKIHAQTPVDIVITDLIMPEKEGIETIQEFREVFPNTKIIAMSGGGVVGAEVYLKIAKGLGAEQVYLKPIESERLLRGIHALLKTA